MEGFYQTILNIDTRYRNTGEVYKTIALIEPGIDVGTVMRAVTASSKLQTGFNAFMHSGVIPSELSSNSGVMPSKSLSNPGVIPSKLLSIHTPKVVQVKGTLALAPADLVQLCAQCRHGGSASSHNCPNCTVIISDRSDTTISVTDLGITRTRQQTDRIIDICLEWIKAETQIREDNPTQKRKEVPISVIEDIRREFAIKLEPSWYKGWDFDEHRQGFREAEHLFYYGIFREQLSWMTNDMDPAQQTQFIARIDSFQWADNMPSLSFDFNPSRGKKRWGTDVSMAMYKQLFIATLFALDGLILPQRYNHFAALWLWHLEILDQHNSVDDIPALQARGLTLIKEGAKLMPDVYDRPNGHGIIELIRRTLPALVYIRLVTSGNFERHHQLTKRTNPSRYFIRDAMKAFNVVDTLRLTLHGTRWGTHRQYILGHGLRTLRDPKRPNVPHKLILNITSVLTQPVPKPEQPNLYHYHGDWDPYSYEYLSTSNHARSDAPTPEILKAIHHQLIYLNETVDPDRCKWRYPTQLRKWFRDGDHRTLAVGHTVVGEWDTGESFAKVKQFIELRYSPAPKSAGRHKRARRLSTRTPTVNMAEPESSEWRIVFVHVHYYENIMSKNQCHPIRKTQLMTLTGGPDIEVFTSGHLTRQVLAVHACHHVTHAPDRPCCQRNHSQGSLQCVTKAICPHHNATQCTEHTCADRHTWIRRIEHNMDHTHFEIADERHGLYFDSPKELKYANINQSKSMHTGNNTQ